MNGEFLEVGYVSGVFGTSGEVKVYLHHPESEMFKTPLECFLSRPETTVVSTRLSIRKGAGKKIIGRFSNISSRTDAESLTGVRILVARASLPSLDPDEYYIDDLLGLQVWYGETAVGRVEDVHNTARGDVLEVHLDKEVHFIPLMDEFVDEVDIRGGRIQLTSEGVASL